MKTNPSTLFSAGLAVALAAPAFALEAPADNSPPPPAVNSPAADAPAIKPLRFDPPAAQKNLPEAPATAFLGIVTSDVPEVLSEHLDLKADEGIIVRSLMPDGPAAKAGITVHDVILRVADQAINSPADISKCVEAQKPGDKVTLEIIHKGKPAKVDVNLGSRPAGITATEPQPMDQLNLEEFPKELADRIRGAIEGNIGALDLHDDPAGQLPPVMGNALQEMKKQMEKALGAPPVMNAGGIHLQGGTVRMRDPEGSVEVKANDGSKEVTIRDNADKVIWTGPWDTEQDKAAAPADVRKRVDNLHLNGGANGNGIHLQLNAPAAPDADGP
ncbi:MAG: PDZ domain-containing protein [Luteolibacter sp.]